jgi:sec-independent protein translocase protein TatC
VAAGLYIHERRYVHIFAPFSMVLFILGGLFCIWVMAPLCCNYLIQFGTSIKAPSSQNTFITRLFIKDKSPAGTTEPPSSPPAATEQPSPPQAPSAGEPPSQQPLIKPWFTLQSYVTFIVITALAFGAAFQMPLVVFILGRVNIVSLKTLKKIRKYAFFVILILAAVLAPSPDVLSQFALAIPMYILYEVGILMLKLWPASPK